MDYSVSKAFEEIENELIADMTRRLSVGIKIDDFDISEWKKQQLLALENFRKENPEKFKEKFEEINVHIAAEIENSYKKGSEREKRIIRKMITAGYHAPKRNTKRNNINKRKLKALLKAVLKDFEKAEYSILRRADDEYRKIIFNTQVAYNTESVTIYTAIDRARKAFLEKGIDCIEYKNGARHTMRSYSEMALRTANRRAAIQGETSARDEYSIRTVIVTPNASPCPLCEQFVGKVFYDDVYSSIQGPLDRKYPLLSNAIKRGLFHPNCTDTISTYYAGITKKPIKPTGKEKEEAEQLYKDTQEQRYNERQIRKYKQLAENSFDEENRKRYKAKAAEWQKINKEFVDSHGKLKRNYKREQI